MTADNPQQGPDSDVPVDETGAVGTDLDVTENIIHRVSNRSFTEWYNEQQFEQNILEGKAYFNGPSPPKDPERHTPSKLLQCHRKASYARQNTPREGVPPKGLFWVGSAFEEDFIVPYLQEVIPDRLYVQNSLWIDTTISRDGTELRIRGSTDPAIVTSEANPLFLTEIKTTTSLDHLDEPKSHHKAQLHAYLYALNETSDFSITDGMLVYGSRETFDLKTFHVTFDSEFWDTVVEWMVAQTEYEQDGELPPATPERDWECNYCSFKHRCGKANTPYADIGYTGLLPLFEEYDRENLIDYLDSRADAKLTPTLAYVFTNLTDTYGVYDWSCPRCSETYAWDAVDWDGDTSEPPVCPDCFADGELLTLSGPEPAEQQ
ncbi:PD-(D/E)XK nuclease family protein [Halorubrum distributum]|uniref:CRISPR-associated protein Cas4 n=1 Tax=Halorubrum distributum TaxID=29283 RepID=UPI002953DA5B|nr:PD-(D/E)XK nuclease family protein [Halorubrum distributum]MDV7351352.1 PD-(D/E)XK nuclease family protein [Halorubrum distributum]